MHDLSNRLKGCFAATFADLPTDKISEACVESVSGWDSMSTVILLSVVEEEFAVRVPPEDILRFTSYDGIQAYLREQCGTREDAAAEQREAS